MRVAAMAFQKHQRRIAPRATAALLTAAVVLGLQKRKRPLRSGLLTAGLVLMLQEHAHRLGERAMAALLTAIALLARELWFRYNQRYRPQGVRFIPGHWLLGSFPAFWKLIRTVAQKEHLDFAFQLHREFGKTFAFKCPFLPWWVVTTCPENVKHILSSRFENYPKGEWFRNNLAELLGNGIFNVDGKEWHRQRAASSLMFSAKPLQEHAWMVVQRNARKLRHILQAAGPREPLDIFNLMNRFTLDTIGEIGFGQCIGSLEDPSSPVLESFDKAQRIAFTRFYIPFWQLCRRLGLGFETETAKHFRRLDAYCRSVTRDLQASIAREEDSTKSSGVSWADIEARKSFVGLFLQDAKQRGERLSEDYLRDLVLNFLIAARDATAQALSWTVFLLCRHPEVEARARQEIYEVCGLRGPSYEDMNRLPYLQAVLDEALRLYPSVPLNFKCVAEEDTLPDGTFVPRGTYIMYNLHSMGRDCDLWGESADEFRPERWLQMGGPPSNYKYPVFNAGPRECPGRSLAHVEIKTCLATLLPQMSFRLAVRADEITSDAKLTIGMGRGLPCFVVCSGEKDRLESSSSTAEHSDLGETSSTHSEWTSMSETEEGELDQQWQTHGEEPCTWQTHVEEPNTFGQPSSAEDRGKNAGSSKGRTRRSGRARQREKRRRRLPSPSPEYSYYGLQ